MFRQGIRRCAGLAGSAASASTLVRGRAALPLAASLSRTVALRFQGFARVSRAYASEATAFKDGQEGEASATADASQFAYLAQSGVHPNLLKAIIGDMGYDTMTPVQAKTIHPALKGTDIVAQAKTGTGKTLAFLLPLLQRMINDDASLAKKQASRRARPNDIRGIILSPTRELALQIANEAVRLTRHTGLVVQSAVGGTQKSAMLLKTQREGCHLLVGTPGRLCDLLHDPMSRIEAPNLAALVLDEADRMLDVGFEKELNDIIHKLPKPDEKIRQTMLVSATIPDDVIRLARSMVRPDDFKFVQTIAENESLTHEKVPQNVVPVSSWANVFPALFEFVDREAERARSEPKMRPFKAIVYFNTTAMVEFGGEVAYHRRKNGTLTTSSFVIHSKLSQSQRSNITEMFRRAKSGILISTDVTARGIDFPDVTHVIQVDAPEDRESYIHRLGRTGRQDKEGEGWLFLPPVSVSRAKHLLRGMPLQQNTSLESATIDADPQSLAQFHKEMADIVQAMDRRLFTAAYCSLFGRARDKLELAQDLNSWATRALGMSDPPRVSARWAQLTGLMGKNCGLNIGGIDDRSSGDSGSSDAFSDIGRLARRDDGGLNNGRPRGFGRDSVRGYGGGRGSGRGYGRDSGRGYGRDSGRGYGRDSGRDSGRGFGRDSGRDSDQDFSRRGKW